MRTSEFLATHPVFHLGEAAAALDPPGGKTGAVERLKYHLERGRVKLVTREVYATVPPGILSDRFQPDPFLVAAAMRPHGIFSHHSALELLGVAHSSWSLCTLYASPRRSPLAVGDLELKFLGHPGPFRTTRWQAFATRQVERRSRLLRVTGPERTLVEGFRRPDLAGGLEELVASAEGFPSLDLDLLEEVLRHYRTANLWAAVGWFLERFRRQFFVPDEFLARLERHRPKSPQYLLRRRRAAGTLARRWNLLLPAELAGGGEPDEP